MKRYDYSITQDGELLLHQLRNTHEYLAIRQAVDRITEAGDPNYVELSIAAKAFFLLRKKGASMSVQELQREAERYNWSISPSSISKAVAFLQSVGLARTN